MRGTSMCLGLATIVSLASAGVVSVGASAQRLETLSGLEAPASAVVVLIERPVDYSGDYQVEVQNLDPRGTVDTFTWTPPPSLNVTAVTATQGGACSITAAGAVQCTVSLGAPNCTSSSSGGTTCHPAATSAMTFNFTAVLTGFPPGASFTQNLFLGAYQQQLQVTGMTLLPPPVVRQFTDLPLCAKGHSSTKAKPCVKR